MTEYAIHAGNGEDLDIKDRGLEEAVEEGMNADQHRYRGSVTNDGKIASARDFGNMGAGIVAARNNLTWKGARLAFDTYQSYTSSTITTEGVSTQKAQYVGFKIGVNLRPTRINTSSSRFKRFGEN